MTTVRLTIGSTAANLDASNPRLVIGRDESQANLVSPDGSVSRRHAEVVVQNGQVWLRDMGSSNGTWVNGAPVGPQGVQLQAGQQVFVGHVPLLVEWQGGGQQGATVMGALPPELAALIEQRKQQAQSQVSAPSVAPASAGLNAAGSQAPSTRELTYRRQGSNNNGVLLVALPGDTFTNDSVLKGFLEFTATDDESVSAIAVELVENHRRKKGHAWDKVIVKQGPWKCRKNDKVPTDFELRIPSSTSISGPDVHWEIRAYVDIAWAFDVEVTVPITMRNRDVEKVRDALGTLDYRVVDLKSKPLGQQFIGRFDPPAQWRDQMNIDCINLEIQYLGANLEVMLEVDKRGMFSSDKRTKIVYELAKLRSASVDELSQQLHQHIDHMMRL